MADRLLLSLSTILLVSFAITLVIRTVVAERSAGTGSVSPQAFMRPALVRRLDVVAGVLAVSALAAGILRVVFGVLG